MTGLMFDIEVDIFQALHLLSNVRYLRAVNYGVPVNLLGIRNAELLALNQTVTCMGI